MLHIRVILSLIQIRGIIYLYDIPNIGILYLLFTSVTGIYTEIMVINEKTRKEIYNILVPKHKNRKFADTCCCC